MFGDTKEAMVRRAMQNVTLSETPQGRAVAKVVAGIEEDVAESVDHLLDAVDADDSVSVDYDSRYEDVLGVLDDVTDDNVAERALTECGIEQPERAARHAGRNVDDDGEIGTDEWAEQKREWYNTYADRDAVAGDETVDEVADRHVRTLFGVGLDEFETVVTNRTTGDHLSELLLRPTLDMADVVDRVADEIEEGPDRDP